jgi:hypothetical protein
MSTDSARPTEDGMSIFSTLEAFNDGLTTTLSRSAAANICRGWAEKIGSADRPDLEGVRNGLVTLARQLDGQQAEGPATASDIGDTMKRLGAHTAEAADTLPEAHLRDPLRRLGGYVKAAGIALAGGTRPDEIAGISTELGDTPGDPELRTANAAPDLSDGNGAPSGEIDVSSDETPGTALNPH